MSGAPSVVVIGGSNVDVKARSTAPATPHTSNPGQTSITPGGVGRNVAENLARLGTATQLITVIGRDPAGDDLLRRTSEAGVQVDHVHRTDSPTGTYTAVLDHDGELLVAVADMGATAELGAGHLDAARPILAGAALIVLDGNLAPAALLHALDAAHDLGVRTVLEPVSVPKSAALAARLDEGRPAWAVTPNVDELAALTGCPTDTDAQVRRAADHLHARGIQHVWVRLGRRGSLLSSAGRDAVPLAATPASVHDVTGAGDAALAAFCHALVHGADTVQAARLGHAAAALTLESAHTVRPDLSAQLVRDRLDRPRSAPQ